MSLFPDLDAGQVLEATSARWDLSGPLPVPHPGWLVCPVCGGTSIQPRFWRFHERSGKPTVRGRCDVSFKCTLCAVVWIHGVALDVDAWERRKPTRVNVKVHWREARDIIEEHHG